MRKQAILISEEVFRELSPLPGTFDYKYLKPHILSAQDQHIQPVLGSKLYFDLQAKIYDGTLSDDEKLLLNDYIAKVLVYFSLYAAASFLSVKFENTGIVQKTTNDTTSITLTDADKLAEKLLSSAEFYKQRLIDFLQFNKETFPLYEVAVNDDIPASTENFRGFFSYDDYEEPNYPAGSSSGGQGTTDHRQLTAESRNANDQHIINSVTGLRSELDSLLLAIQTEALNREANDDLIRQDLTIETANRTAADSAIIDALNIETAARIAKDDNLQDQIFHIVENSPIDIVRFFTRNQITLSGQTVYLSSETKGTNAALNITQAVTGTNRATANVIAKFAGDTPLTVTRELPAQNTSLFLRLNKNNTTRNVFVFVEFYDYSATGVLTLKGTTSDFSIVNAVDVYNVLLQIEAYIAQVGARSWIEIKSYQTGTGTAAQTTLGIEGDYYSRFQYRIPAGALSFLDDKVISTQVLPSRDLLSGVTQKEVNKALANYVERGITIDGGSVDVVRDYYSAEATISEIIGRGVTLVELSTDNITFEPAIPPFNVTGDIYWRITPSTEKSFVKIKGQLV